MATALLALRKPRKLAQTGGQTGRGTRSPVEQKCPHPLGSIHARQKGKADGPRWTSTHTVARQLVLGLGRSMLSGFYSVTRTFFLCCALAAVVAGTFLFLTAIFIRLSPGYY